MLKLDPFQVCNLIYCVLQRWSFKNKTIPHWETRLNSDLQRECVSIKIPKYILTSSPFQSLHNLNHLVVGVGYAYYLFTSLYFRVSTKTRCVIYRVISSPTVSIIYFGLGMTVRAPSLSGFWLSFNKKEEYSILLILCCYSLEQHIILAFWYNFDTTIPCSRIFFPETKYCYSPKWRQKPTRPILRYYLVVKIKKKKILPILKIHTK